MRPPRAAIQWRSVSGRGSAPLFYGDVAAQEPGAVGGQAAIDGGAQAADRGDRGYAEGQAGEDDRACRAGRRVGL